MGEHERGGHQTAHDVPCGEAGRIRSTARRSGRHHRTRARWHLDRCSGCGLIRRGSYGDASPRTSSYLTANRLSPPSTARPFRGRPWSWIDAAVLLAGVVLLFVAPTLGWLFLV